MPYQVAIIGSFRKYYDQILEIIKEFKKNGLYVSSPKESFINNKIGEFVIFNADDQTQTPAEIQMVTLERILNADAVYVYNPNGYIGKTTCYEIGFCFSRYKPIYFYEKPDDLPIPWDEKIQILSPTDFAKLISQKEQHFITNYKLCDEATDSFNRLFDINITPRKEDRKIVICGSMQFYKEMQICQQELKEMGINSIIPKEENDIVQAYNEEQFMAFKRKVSNIYLRKIRDKGTIGVLIYNAEKRGIKNYIGANTLVELAMAFAWNRSIFLYNDIYETLKEELVAWGSICLHGKLSSITKYIQTNDYSVDNHFEQLNFFE